MVWHHSFGEKKFRVLPYQREFGNHKGETIFHFIEESPRYKYPKMETYHRKEDAIARATERLEQTGRWAKYQHEERGKNRAYVPNVKKGDILHSSWGYDQTNCDFYQIVDVKGKMVKVRHIGNKSAGEDMYVPDVNNFCGEVMRRRVSPHGGVKINSVQHASKWTGSPEYETHPGMGH